MSNRPETGAPLALSAVLLALSLGGCVTPASSRIDDPAPRAERADAPRAATLDDLAAEYVRLSLEIGTHEDGYIDAYYGDPAIKAAAEASPRAKPALQAEVRALRAKVDALGATLPDLWLQRRARFLSAQLLAADTRLRMMQGERLSFGDEAAGLFGVRPQPKPLAQFDPVLARIERLVPGPGSLAARVDAFQNRFVIAPDRLQPVFDAAIAACRAATARHIALPPGETFRMEFVTAKPWSGYNWYQGRYNSLIQINTDLPIRLPRAVDLGCHEGYPGHHLLNLKLEEKLTRARGWTEFSVYPLYSPQSLIAEGSANYGIDLAFPPAARLAFERDRLFPLAGLNARDAARFAALQAAMKDLSGARLTIAQQYLDGVIDRATALSLSQKYQLLSPERAEQQVKFTETYRSYVLNYGLGADMVAAAVERGTADTATRWRRMERIVSEPTLPSDLAAME